MLHKIVGRALLLGSLSALAIASVTPQQVIAQELAIPQTHNAGGRGSDAHVGGRRGDTPGGHDGDHSDDHGDDGGCEDDCGDDHDDDTHDDHGDDHEGRGKGPKYRGGRGVVDETSGGGDSLEDRVLRVPSQD